MKKIAIILLVLVLLMALLLRFTKLPEPIPADTQSAKMLQVGEHAVVLHKLTLVDNSRPTIANGDVAAIASRTLPVFVWSPAQPLAEPQPLVVYSHGFMSNGQGGEYLGEHLASYGYTVVAATYPLTSYSAPGGAKAEDVINQPADISFIIDSLLAKNDQPGGSFAAQIDPARIAVVGMSMGGMTTEMVAYHPTMGDQRISAAVSIAGPAFMFSKVFFEHRRMPFMMVASPQDALINYQENAANILAKVDGAYLVSVAGGSHLGFSGGSKWLRWLSNPDSLGCKALLDDDEVNGDSDWYHKIGDAQIGVLPATEPTMCADDPLPKAINTLRQLQLTKLAVSSFLQCYFSSEEQQRADNCRYLKSTFAEEIAEVSVSF